MRPTLTVRLNYNGMAVNSMEFNGVRPARNIQFDLAGDLRLRGCLHEAGLTLGRM